MSLERVKICSVSFGVLLGLGLHRSWVYEVQCEGHHQRSIRVRVNDAPWLLSESYSSVSHITHFYFNLGAWWRIKYFINLCCHVYRYLDGLKYLNFSSIVFTTTGDCLIVHLFMWYLMERRGAGDRNWRELERGEKGKRTSASIPDW